MTHIERKELTCRIEYAKRQFQVATLRAQLQLALGKTQYAQNHIRFAEECSDHIDKLTRQLEGLE